MDSNEIATKRVFLAGENHTFLESNSLLWVQNIKYLHSNAGVRNVLMEAGGSIGWLVNQYVQTGDTFYLSAITEYTFDEYSESFKSLKRFNNKLDSTEKIKVIGIDLERSAPLALKVLSMLMPKDKTPHDSISLHIEAIEGMVKYQEIEKLEESEEDKQDPFKIFKYLGKSYRERPTIRRVIDNFYGHKEYYKDFLGDNFNQFEDVVYGLKKALEWFDMEEDDATQGYIFREQYMFGRFREVYDSNAGGYYGQFGRCHTTKTRVDQNTCKWYAFKSFANRLSEDPNLGLADKVFTMGILYKNGDEDEDFGESTEKVNEIFYEMDELRVLLVDFKTNEVLASTFEANFDMLFFNTCFPSEKHPYFHRFDDPTTFNILAGQYYSYDFDLTSLAQSIPGAIPSEYSNPITLYAFSYSNKNYSESGRVFMSRSVIGGFKSVNQSTTAGNSTKLSGFMWNTHYLFDLLPNVKAVDIAPGLSLGYTRLKLMVDRTDATGTASLDDGFLGTESKSIYYNPAITTGWIFSVGFNLGALSLFGEMGQQFDLSNKNWRGNGQLLTGGPETSISGKFFSVGIGFNFEG